MSRKKKQALKFNTLNLQVFLYHKGAAFIDREGELKQAKDLYYIYFILRCTLDLLDIILTEVDGYKKKDYFIAISKISRNILKEKQIKAA